MVFFTGTLQEGISTALQQSKLVVCFVSDDKGESKRWESEYLTDETIAPLLGKDAVVLRLEAGSEEAGYLAAIFPLPKTPTVVVIRNGQMKEYVSAGTSKEDFVSRISEAFSPQTDAHAELGASAAPVTQTGTSSPASAAPSPPNITDNPAPAQTTSSGQAPATSTTEHLQGPTQAQLLAEAEHRRQVARKEREDIEKERRRKDKGKMPASQDPKQDDAVKKASQQLAERQRKAREDKARVLKLIEDDKAERRARSERQRAERQANVSEDMGETTPGAALAPSSSAARRYDQCAIQVRLFDGSTIRTRFPAKATISQEVRKWVDENRTDGNDPYTFKIILTPLPNKAIDHGTEEDQTLEELGLAPSSTLVLTPVDRYSSAYTNMNAGLTNPVSRLVTAVLAFLVNILGGVTGALGGLGHVGTTASSTGDGSSVGASQHDRGESQGQAAASGRDGSGRIKGFQNPNDQRDHQLYNGNSLNFEPRKDEEDKDK
ncbi:hypothetical protein N0V82_006987 [Gnomoniopsis sp. IMI 355080]|nr:hypothetical protein N0V82_006987 [Gnomoniopsis sp. IMI 355080]